jgi:hypothetical protein
MKKRSGNRAVEEGDWRIGRSLPENFLHGRPVSEVFLQPSTANFNIAIIKKRALTMYRQCPALFRDDYIIPIVL